MIKTVITAIIITLFSQVISPAATITHLGIDEDRGEAWRSVNISKPANFDPNGDNAYGSDGYYCTWRAPAELGHSGVLKRLPTYISSVARDITMTIYSSPGWAALDDPSATLTSSVTNMGSTGWFYTGSGGVYTKYFTITLAKNANFLLTILMDVTAHTTTKIKLIGSGTTKETTVLAQNGTPDFYFFQLTGNMGDTFEIWFEGNNNTGCAGFGFEQINPTTYPCLSENHGETWRSTNINKPDVFDPDGDNVYGSDGYYCSWRGSGGGASGVLKSLPTYISGVLQEPISMWASPSWAKFDDPSLTPGPDLTNMGSTGCFYTNTTNLYKKFFTVTLAETSDFLLTILLDAIVTYPTSSVKVIGPSTTNEITGLVENIVPDYAFFRITGNAGDTFEVWLNGTPRVNTAGLGFEAFPPVLGTIVIIR